MRSAVLVLGLCALLPLVHGQCFQALLKRGVNRCWDKTDKTWHAIGTTWTNSRCVECSCNAKAMSCCNNMATVTGYPEDCEVKYDYTKCTFDVIKKNNPSEHCEFQAVLK